jgi:hypothetical protein
MRLIIPLILRLFVDDETPEKLRGALQRADNQQAYPFENEQALLKLLRSFSGDKGRSPACPKANSEKGDE